MKNALPKTRRSFIKLGSLGTLLGVSGLPLLATPQAQPVGAGADAIPHNLTVLFQGDSITDAGRNRGAYYANNGSGMGSGYVYQIVADLLANNPGKEFKFYNRGISGNKVYQLANRWQDDCIQLKPDVLSILIGVNDYWHTLSHNYSGTPEIFEKDLRNLLADTVQQFPNVKLILGEPFAVKGGSAIGEVWSRDFPAYQQAIKSIAQDMNAALVPFQHVFDQALELAPVDYWCPDGVHPSMAGSALMKAAWLSVFNKMWA